MDAYAALGSNVQPLERLPRAARLMKQTFAGIRFSSCYRNAAVGFEGDDFINAAVVFPWSGSYSELVLVLHDIEERCGRRRGDAKWAPRAMDIDILLLGDRIIVTPQGRVPRADLLRRAYMLGPAAELAPDVLHPEVRKSLSVCWRELQPAAPPLHRIDLDLNAA